MARNPDITIIRVDATQVCRGDFAGSSDVPQSVQILRRSDAGDTLADATFATIGASGKPARRVWVFSDEVWSQSVSLPTAQVSRLPREDLARALAFEAEPFSNIPPGEAAVGFRHTATRSHINSYAVVIGPQDDIAALRVAVKNAGGRLRGVSRPGVISIDRTGGEPMSSTDQSQEAIREWLSACHRTLKQNVQGMVAIKPYATVPLLQRQIMAGALASALIALLCMAHWLRAGFFHGTLQAQLAEIQRETNQITAVESANAGVRRQLDESRKHAEAQRNAVGQLATARGTLPLLLRAIAEHRPGDVVVRQIRDHGEGRHGIEGLSISARAVDEFAGQLAGALHDAGWSVAIVSKTAQGTLADGGPWQFELQLAASAPLIPRRTAPASQPVRPPPHARFQ